MTPPEQQVISTSVDYLSSRILTELASSSAFFGFYFLAFVLTIRTCRINSPSQRVMLTLIVLSFVMCCWDIVTKAARLLVFIRVSLMNPPSTDLISNFDAATNTPLNATIVWPLKVNLLVGDLIITWRAFVLWGGRKSVKYLLIVLMIANAGAGIGDALMDNIVVGSGPTAGIILDCISSFLSFSVNVLATFMAIVTAWRYREISIHRRGIEKLILFLIESGMCFCILQLLYALVQLPSLEAKSKELGVNLFTACFCNITAALNPMATIAFVNILDLSFAESRSDERGQDNS